MEYIIVQAGGKGTRLGYLTKNKPKALVPVENLPMIFHLFRKYPDKRFVIISDYHKKVLREYLACFAKVKYQIVEAPGTGTCSGIGQALELIPGKKPFMLVWSDLILSKDLKLPDGYEEKNGTPQQDYIGISETFPCRWSYHDGQFTEVSSCEEGVAGFFLFTDKNKLKNVPDSGELVRWMEKQQMLFKCIGLAGTKEFGLLEEYEKLGQDKCRPFNRITIENHILIKEPVDEQGRKLAVRECAWYRKAKEKNIQIIPKIYAENPLRMEYIRGKNIYEYRLSYIEKKKILSKLIQALESLHQGECVPADSFSMKEAYFYKTMERLKDVEELIPFAHDQYIRINGKNCRNVYFYKRKLEQKLEQLKCKEFRFIHGDCTFSNLMLREDMSPVLIDPRGYFGFTEIYGDTRLNRS